MIRVGNLTIGEGQPKICASITETSQKAIIAAADIMVQKHIDIVEWRMDYYEAIDHREMIEETLHRLSMSLFRKPLLVTFRTKQEGGKGTLDWEEYRELLLFMAKSPYVQMVDVEVFHNLSYEEVMQTGIEEHVTGKADEMRTFVEELRKDVVVIGSYHNFQETPSFEEMQHRFRFMDWLGVDILKMAVMPTDKADVIKLMAATLEVSKLIDKPFITMSMGKLGSISRMMGEAFNSSVTFASVGQSSAPGQIAVAPLEDMMDRVHQFYR